MPNLHEKPLIPSFKCEYLIMYTQQLGVKEKTTVQPKHAEQRKPTQSKLDTM